MFELSSFEADVFSEGSTTFIHGEHLLVLKLTRIFIRDYYLALYKTATDSVPWLLCHAVHRRSWD